MNKPEENPDKIYLTSTSINGEQRCAYCIYAKTNNIVHGMIECMRNPDMPIPHSSDHLCMCFEVDRNRISRI
mgnify:CR=1 FL=1